MLKDICLQFCIEGELCGISPYGEGHINTSYLAVTDKKRYILQKMNTFVFPDTDALMKNVCAVTGYLKSKGEETLNVVSTKIGEPYLNHESGKWRMYDFIENTVTYQTVSDTNMFRRVGGAFGAFQNSLAGFDASYLSETIPDFHNTVKRFKTFKSALSDDVCGRKKNCTAEAEFILKREKTLGKVVSGLESGEIPLRVTHNDTKLNNILMDKTSGEARAVIDLDTVMAGSLLYDFGDSIRFGASTAGEDEEDLSKVHLSVEAFKAYAQGYLGAVKNSITKRETELLPYGAYLMMTECGMRFLTDYLSGDKYFKIKYPEHNLIRARTQLKLAGETEERFEELGDIIKEITEK